MGDSSRVIEENALMAKLSARGCTCSVCHMALLLTLRYTLAASELSVA